MTFLVVHIANTIHCTRSIINHAEIRRFQRIKTNSVQQCGRQFRIETNSQQHQNKCYFPRKKSIKRENVINLLIHIWILNRCCFFYRFFPEKLYHIYINVIKIESVYTQARDNSIKVCWQQPCAIPINCTLCIWTQWIHTKFFKLKCENTYRTYQCMGIAYLNCIREQVIWFSCIGGWFLATMSRIHRTLQYFEDYDWVFMCIRCNL